MNIVTQELLRRIKDRHLHDFVSHWDELEALVIGIYRTNFATAADHETYRRLKDWLSRRYPGWQSALRSHWQGVRIEGEIVQADPFLEILAVDDAAVYAGDWRAMQTLPAAREALNSLLISIIEGSTSIKTP